MPRKASARSSAKAGKTAAQKRSDETPEERRERKAANPAHREASEETARINASAQTVGPEVRDARGETPKDTSKAKSKTRLNANGEADAKDPIAAARKLQATQGPDGHPYAAGPEKREKPSYKKAEVKAPSGAKITRLEGEAPKPYSGHVVQPGGGGAPLTAEGNPIPARG